MGEPMPERILRDYSDSEKFDGFAQSPETLFTRLLTKVDDYGRYSRDPLKVRADCFPRIENLRANTVDAWLEELSGHRLILCYRVTGKLYLAIVNFRQRLREHVKKDGAITLPVPKFPPPEGKDVYFRPDDGDWKALMGLSSDSPRMAGSGGVLPPYAYAIADTKSLTNAESCSGAKNNSLLKAEGMGERGKGQPIQGHHSDPAPSAAENDVKRQFAAGHAQALLGYPNMGSVIQWILGNKSNWDYDNSKVRTRDFSPAQLKTVLAEFIGRVSIAQAQRAWSESATITHQAVVDRMPNATANPPAYCISTFKNWLKAFAEGKQQPEAPESPQKNA